MLQETQELTAEQVRSLIEHIYCKKYIGKLDLKPLTNLKGEVYGYWLSLGLGCDERPLQIAFDGTAREFLQRLEKRLRYDHIADTEFSYGVKGDRPEDININPKMKPCSSADYTVHFKQ